MVGEDLRLLPYDFFQPTIGSFLILSPSSHIISQTFRFANETRAQTTSSHPFSAFGTGSVASQISKIKSGHLFTKYQVTEC